MATMKEKTAAPAAKKAQESVGARRRADVEEDRMVRVEVPRAFRVQVSPGVIVAYEAGIQRMPQSHADHPYSKANGVKRSKSGDE